MADLKYYVHHVHNTPRGYCICKEEVPEHVADNLTKEDAESIVAALQQHAGDQKYIEQLQQALVDLGVNPFGSTFREKYVNK